jgi:hypothetical protein
MMQAYCSDTKSLNVAASIIKFAFLVLELYIWCKSAIVLKMVDDSLVRKSSCRADWVKTMSYWRYASYRIYYYGLIITCNADNADDGGNSSNDVAAADSFAENDTKAYTNLYYPTAE